MSSGWFELVAAGVAVGTLSGVFGVGGASLATPLLAVLGVPPLLAVASPLPATIPTALAAAGPYAFRREVQWSTAMLSLAGAVPATLAGALLSKIIGGPLLLLASGLAMIAVGYRVVLPISAASVTAGSARRAKPYSLVAAAAGVGLFTGLLANGGGFLLVPLYLLLFGIGVREAAGTSLVVIAVLTIPTLVAHWALGHIDWSVAAAFAVGSVPASVISSLLSPRITGNSVRRAFGVLLIGSGGAFIAYRLFG